VRFLAKKVLPFAEPCPPSVDPTTPQWAQAATADGRPWSATPDGVPRVPLLGALWDGDLDAALAGPGSTGVDSEMAASRTETLRCMDEAVEVLAAATADFQALQVRVGVNRFWAQTVIPGVVCAWSLRGSANVPGVPNRVLLRCLVLHTG
jgi:hypothetical protein